MFDGEKRRFEQSGLGYRYVVPAAEAQAAEAKGLTRQEMLKTGLIEEFQARIVSIYDGEALLKYRENGGASSGSTVIDDPAKGSGEYLFDPRCLGLVSAFSPKTTIESLRQFYSEAKSTRLAGKDFVEGNPAWHVQMFSKNDQSLDFWIDVAHPQRVVKHADGHSEVLSRFDDATPKDPLPVQVAVIRYGPAGYQRLITRSNARLNVPVAPASFTLAGLGMPVGTDVADVRIHRGIGYWTGTGLAENPPRKTGEPQAPPDLVQLVSVLENDPSSEAALNAARWILLNTQDGPEVEKAAAVILQEHIRSADLVRLAQEMERMRHRCSGRLLEAMLEKNPSAEVQGNACLMLALLRKDEAKYGENRQATAEAERLFERVIGQFGRVKRNGEKLADLAEEALFELRKLFIGKPAPETEGEDLDGRPLKLSDYRGKVVLLIFWARKCLPANVPDLVTLLDRFKGKPFAILGVYCDPDPAWGKEIAQESGMTWPSFCDGRLGPIYTAWHNPGWPVFHIVDAKGIIRSRHLPESDVAKAVEAAMSK